VKHVIGVQARRWVVVVGLCMTLSVLCSTRVAADEPALGVAGNQPIRDNLKQRIGGRVLLRLVSGEEIGGTVVQVGEHAVHVSGLTGRDFYDAVIRLDQVSAVIIRVREK
jgi:hypothetical protein